jgi:hypothetical protein
MLILWRKAQIFKGKKREAVMVGRELLSKLSGPIFSCSDHRMQDKNHFKTDNMSIGNVAVLKLDGWACDTNKGTYVYKILVEKLLEKRSLKRSRHRWEIG